MSLIHVSFDNYFFQASVIVQAVMVFLLIASIFSWALILQRGWLIRHNKKQLFFLNEKLTSGTEWSKLLVEFKRTEKHQFGIQGIFCAGFSEYLYLEKQTGFSPEVVMVGVQRAMQVAYATQQQRLEKQLDWLATVGSTSPYVGLFGTVWGIMTSFQALASSQQTATIAMVAPGISEALVATAMGLLVAIPAVVFYNHYLATIQSLLQQYVILQEQILSVLYRQLYGNTHAIP